jgi:hypothetical protein
MAGLDFFNKNKYPEQNNDPFRVGYVTGFTQGDQVVKVRFSGETTPVTCNVTSSFIPFNGLKVLCAKTGKSYTILDYVSTKPMNGVVIATANLTKTSSITLSNIPGLMFNVEPNGVYYVEARIDYTTSILASDGTADGNLRTAWSGDASWLRHCVGPSLNMTAADNATMRNSAHQLDTQIAYGAWNSVSYQFATEVGILTAGATGGIIQAQAAQSTSAANSTIIRSSSYLTWKRLA